MDQMEVEEPEQYSGASGVEPQNREVMELSDPDGHLSSVGTPIVFAIPNPGSMRHDVENECVIIDEDSSSDEDDEDSADEDLADQESDDNEGEDADDADDDESESDEDTEIDPKDQEAMKRLEWLAFPNRVLNKMSSEKQLFNHKYKHPGRGDKFVQVIQPSQEESSDSEWETVSESSEESGDPDAELESTYVYVELDEIASIQELFAINPDDFLRFQNRQARHKPQPVKPTYPQLELKFHQFDSSQPVLQIGQKYYTGSWEESTGSAMFFKKTTDECDTLKNIVEEPEIPFDEVFSNPNSSSNPIKDNYELVALADKVLKLQAYEAGETPLYKIPRNNRPLVTAISSIKVPRGYTMKEMLSGKYVPKRSFRRRRNLNQYSFGNVIRSGGSLKDIKDRNENDEDGEFRIDDDEDDDDEEESSDTGDEGDAKKARKDSTPIATAPKAPSAPIEEVDDDVVPIDPLETRLEQMTKEGTLYLYNK